MEVHTLIAHQAAVCPSVTVSVPMHVCVGVWALVGMCKSTRLPLIWGKVHLFLRLCRWNGMRVSPLTPGLCPIPGSWGRVRPCSDQRTTGGLSRTRSSSVATCFLLDRMVPRNSWLCLFHLLPRSSCPELRFQSPVFPLPRPQGHLPLPPSQGTEVRWQLRRAGDFTDSFLTFHL